MICYPVYIPTLNRYEHFRNCVESLARCTHADKTELVVSLDYPPSEKYVEGWKKIKAYLPTLQTLGFGKVTVFEQTKNLGANDNCMLARRYCYSHYKACIGSEDDNVFAPAFLDYINKALERYEYDEKIVSVCGYSRSACECPELGSTYLTYDSCAWGMGIWREKDARVLAELAKPKSDVVTFLHPLVMIKIACTYPYLILMLLRALQTGKKLLGDMLRTTYNFRHGTRQLRPSCSLVRNVGVDGSGLTWGGDIYQELATQPISDATTWELNDAYPKCSNKGLFCQLIKATTAYQICRKVKRFFRRTQNL